MKPGIYPDMPETEYHADKDSISKTGLWTLHSKTPAHYRFAPPREREAGLDFGKAVHMLVLEPEIAREKVVQGPIDRYVAPREHVQRGRHHPRGRCKASSDYETPRLQDAV